MAPLAAVVHRLISLTGAHFYFTPGWRRAISVKYMLKDTTSNFDGAGDQTGVLSI